MKKVKFRKRCIKLLMINNERLQYSNLINLLALAIGMENLSENRQQTAYNDVHASNQKQAEFLLEKIGEKFKEQNEILARILQKLED